MSYSSKFRLVLLAVMAIGLGLALFLKESNDPMDAAEEKTAVARPSPRVQEPSVPAAAEEEFVESAAPSVEADYVETQRAAPERLPPAPSVDSAREEVKANPHAPPKSLLQFANQIADRFDEVEKYPDQSEHFMTELEECVRDSNNRLASARALCLTNAEDLGAMFPQYAERVAQLRASAPPEVRDLARATSMGFEE